jgi:hypothetical protein
MRRALLVCSLCIAAIFACLAAGFPVTAAPKKLLDYHAFAGWRTIRDVHISRDGGWLAYSAVANQADGEVIVRHLTDTTTYREPRGRGPVFSADGRFVIYRISPTLADVRAAAKNPDLAADKKPKDALGILDVRSGSVSTVPRIRSVAVSRDGATLAYLLEPGPPPTLAPAPPPSPAAAASPVPSPSATPSAPPAPKALARDADTSLAIRQLGSSDPAAIEHVTAYTVSADGSRVAYVVQVRGDESLHLRSTSDNVDTIVAHSIAHLVAPVLSRDGMHVAYLSDADRSADQPNKPDKPKPSYRLMLADAGAAPVEVVGPSTPGIVAHTFASDARPIEFAPDAKRLYFATAAVAQPRPSSAPARVDLDFWYARDGKLPTELRRDAESPAYGAHTATYDLVAKRFTQLATSAVPLVALAANGPYALGVSDLPYQKLHTWDGAYEDLYRIDMATGARTMIARKVKGGGIRLSPEGRYAIGYGPAEHAWFTIRLAEGKRTWISDPHRQHVALEDDDHPDFPPPYGLAGFTPHDAAVIYYDRYDIWSASPDGGTPVMLTGGNGRAKKQTFRAVRPLVDEAQSAYTVVDRPVFDRAPYLLSVVDEQSKSSGFATLPELRPGAPLMQLHVAKRLSPPYRSLDASRLVFSQERFDEFPDLWASGAIPVHPVRVTDVNPQMASYAWGHSRLIDYTTAHGKKLRAILTTPDNFDPRKKYPMLVYVYERMTDDVHHYILPTSGTVVNLSRYANHGYVVLQPDITYQIGHTTNSAVDCVTSAVKTVVAMGFVDAKRIGMAGHSYGGYEVNALVTHSNIFRAVESGASDSDLPSLYGGFWQSGDVQQSYYEKGQGRIGATPWERPDLYVENSPLFSIGNVHTPYLRIQDDQDGFVPYGQGVEFFTALRRAGKEAYMFTFIGENHGLAKTETKNYWTVHLDEFFDYYLQGAPRPEWMNHNGSFEHRGERDVEALFTPPA